MTFDRTDMLDKKVDAIASEFNEVLTELQTALTGMMRMHEVYVRVTNARLEAMEAQIKAAVGTPATPKDPNAPGVEL